MIHILYVHNIEGDAHTRPLLLNLTIRFLAYILQLDTMKTGIMNKLLSSVVPLLTV